jgi:pimeloyl-ACP methyl ester carboxylesterase
MRPPLTLDGLEPRLFCTAAPATTPPPSVVTLHQISGPVVHWLRPRTTWVIIPGFGVDHTDIGSRDMAAAVNLASKRDQVLIANWVDYAVRNVNGSTVDANCTRAGRALAGALSAAGVPADKVNLIGISLGSLVADRTAAAFADRGGVNALVALDPATVTTGVNAKGRPVRSVYDLAANSRYALSFHNRNRIGQLYAARTADDTVRVDLTDAGGMSDRDRHVSMFELFTNMASRAATAGTRAGKVSRLFSVNQIAAGVHPAWKRDAYDGVYEAVLSAKGTLGNDLTPTRLRYFAKTGVARAVRGG